MYHARHVHRPWSTACEAPVPPGKILVVADEPESVTCPDCRQEMDASPWLYPRRHHWFRRAA